jgi:predicted SnoaL-like aldol condensation-catalyzing enzyme
MGTALTKQEIAVEFLKMAAGKNVRVAYEKYVASHFRHHNQHFKGDAQSLMFGMEVNSIRNPDKKLEIKKVLADGDSVAIFSHVKLKPSDLGVALVHIFRFEGNQIAELWDIGQPLIENSPNENGMF